MSAKSNEAKRYRIRETVGVSVGPRRPLTDEELEEVREWVERLERRPGRVVDIGADSNGHRATRD